MSEEPEPPRKTARPPRRAPRPCARNGPARSSPPRCRRPSSCASSAAWPHPKFKKIIRVHNKFYAHDEKSEAKAGDRVLIRETRPLSKLKRWELVSILKH